jgi:uncharacterized protein GlcG (DUF336 family)
MGEARYIRTMTANDLWSWRRTRTEPWRDGLNMVCDMPRQIWTLTQVDASFLIDHSINAAKRMGVAVTIVIVEGGGNTVGLLRMDGAKLASIGVAEAKAWTAALFQRPSVDYSAPTAPGGSSYGMPNAYPGKFVPLPGGQPIFVDGTCIGGIGISGASGEQDDSLAEAAVAALMSKSVQ